MVWNKLPLILKCPIGGEEWPITNYQTYADGTAEKVTPKVVSFLCPAGHGFTLSAALRSKMFTKTQGERILETASGLIEKYRLQQGSSND